MYNNYNNFLGGELKDYYLILEVHPKARKEIIQKAYHILAKIFHPDSEMGNDDSMKLINEAYEILVDDNKRAEYDNEYFKNNRINISKTTSVSDYHDVTQREKEIRLREAELLRREKEIKIREEIYKDEKQNFDKMASIRKKLDIENKISFLKDPDYPTNKKYSILKELIRSGKKSLKPLKEAFDTADDEVRYYIIQAISEIGGIDNTNFFINALSDLYSYVRAEAAHCLGTLKAKSAEVLLYELLDDEYSIVREEACFALGEIGFRYAIQKMLEIAKDKKEEIKVKISAINALKKCAGPEILDDLNKLKKNRSLQSAVEKAIFFINQKAFFINKGV